MLQRSSSSPRSLAAAAALAAALAARGCAADLPIAADSLLSLDGAAWTAQSSAGGAAIAASVPGDVVSDLAAAGVIRSPWLDLTWRDEAGRWDLASWTYSVTFATPASWAPGAGAETLLVFDSVKMAASVTLNGASVGNATSQHLRYAFPVGALLAAPGAQNELLVVFPPTVEDARNDAGRFAGCSGGSSAGNGQRARGTASRRIDVHAHSHSEAAGRFAGCSGGWVLLGSCNLSVV